MSTPLRSGSARRDPLDFLGSVGTIAGGRIRENPARSVEKVT